MISVQNKNITNTIMFVNIVLVITKYCSSDNKMLN